MFFPFGFRKFALRRQQCRVSKSKSISFCHFVLQAHSFQSLITALLGLKQLLF